MVLLMFTRSMNEHNEQNRLPINKLVEARAGNAWSAGSAA